MVLCCFPVGRESLLGVVSTSETATHKRTYLNGMLCPQICPQCTLIFPTADALFQHRYDPMNRPNCVRCCTCDVWLSETTRTHFDTPKHKHLMAKWKDQLAKLKYTQHSVEDESTPSVTEAEDQFPMCGEEENDGEDCNHQNDGEDTCNHQNENPESEIPTISPLIFNFGTDQAPYPAESFAKPEQQSEPGAPPTQENIKMAKWLTESGVSRAKMQELVTMITKEDWDKAKLSPSVNQIMCAADTAICHRLLRKGTSSGAQKKKKKKKSF